ncbi:hypothetical protein C0Q70_18139 [Pomacea canaliculata]|uniref:Sulfotransferase domain-containing protein n=1 Tax=Pomacea canaliculata TaxID=400727 RepID=A0A2T7NMD1_POMCA|nr:hypothetical protein C0Q70_18139 [Pomacea canaliculata]
MVAPPPVTRMGMGRLWPRVVATCLVVFVLLTLYISDRYQLRHNLFSLRKDNFQRDLDHIDDILEVSYARSPAAPHRDKFVGSKPLFPPCENGIPPGIPAWGPNPHLGPFNFSNKSKNPCWYQRNSDEELQFLCVPYGFLAGISKSGTSDLFFRISKHPDFINIKKEFHWFDRERYYYNSTFFQYANSFQGLAEQIENDLQTSGKSQKITMDGSPSYFYDSYEWLRFSGNEGCSEPRVILPSHIYHLNPRVKIILIFRHPVQRLYSRFLFDWGRNKSCQTYLTPEKFHEDVVDGLEKFLTCFKSQSLRYCVYDKTLRDSVNMVEPLDHAKMTWVLAQQPKNKGVHTVSAGPMLPETRKILETFYKPFIQRFASMVGDDKFLWKDNVYI